MKKYITFAIKLLFVAALYLLIFAPEKIEGLLALVGVELRLGSLFGDVAVMEVWQALREASTSGPGWFFGCLALAALVKLLGIFAGVVRWRLLLAGQGLKMPLHYMAYQFFMGRAIGLLLPGTLGLDGYRLVESSIYTREPVKCATVIAIEKLIGIVALSFLVFLTFPLGFKFLNISIVPFAVIMVILLGFVTTAFLLLLNPRVIQVMAAVLPVPGKIRKTLDKLGAAATAYSHARGTLLLAVVFGVCVHLSMCLMYFFTFLAIRAENVSMADILFVSPLLITASVLAFTISGLGVREMAFLLVLGGTTGHAMSILGGHLGLWTGELVPFMLSTPLLLFGGRPKRETMDATLAEIRAEVAQHDAGGKGFSPAELAVYRSRVFGTLAAGLLGGLFAGALIGFGEAHWLLRTLPSLTETGMFAWGAAVYGLLFAGVGTGIAGGLLFLYLIFNHFPSWRVNYVLGLAGSLGVGGLVIGMWRFKRDVVANLPAEAREGLAPYLPVLAGVGCVVIGGLILSTLLAWLGNRLWKDRPLPLILSGVGAYLFIVIMATNYGMLHRPEPKVAIVNAQETQGPNLILIGIDTLRADYLSLYSESPLVKTPQLEAFASEAIVFEESFAQASWTKPSFATLFTGLYPEAHTATTKTSAIPEEVECLAELLQDAGYYTQGFSNNPNVDTTFNFHQGFSEYIDLKPELYFMASPSASKLSMYNVLRMVRQRLAQRFAFLPFIGTMRISDFYQPAEAVTQIALDWCDSKTAPEGMPFYLYLHYMDPHDPFMDHTQSGVGYARARLGDPDPEQYEELMREAYCTEIEYMDVHLGALFEGLKARGLWENTAIVFVSDHGEEFYDHGGWWHGQTLFDELIHVPILLKLPNGAHAGERVTGLARHIDIAPSFLHLAGVEQGASMSGQPLYDTRIDAFTTGITAYNYAENDFEGNVLQAVRTKTMKLIHANEDNPREQPPVALYELEGDPAEKENVAGAQEQAEMLEQLEGVLQDYQKVIRENAAEPAGEVTVDSDLADQLESIGYLE